MPPPVAPALKSAPAARATSAPWSTPHAAWARLGKTRPSAEGDEPERGSGVRQVAKPVPPSPTGQSGQDADRRETTPAFMLLEETPTGTLVSLQSERPFDLEAFCALEDES